MIKGGDKHIPDLIAQGEHQQLDFKFEISDTRKIARTLVAFANTDGGRLLIGVKDNGKIAGIRSEEEYYMIDTASTLFCRPEVEFDTTRWKVNGKMVLEVRVHPSDKKPHLAKNEHDRWLAYVRVDDQNLVADPVLLQVWKRRKRKQGTYVMYTETEKQLLECMAKEGPCSLNEMSNLTSLKRKVLRQILVNLVAIEVVEMILTEKDTFYRLADNR